MTNPNWLSNLLYCNEPLPNASTSRLVQSGWAQPGFIVNQPDLAWSFQAVETLLGCLVMLGLCFGMSTVEMSVRVMIELCGNVERE